MTAKDEILELKRRIAELEDDRFNEIKQELASLANSFSAVSKNLEVLNHNSEARDGWEKRAEVRMARLERATYGVLLVFLSVRGVDFLAGRSVSLTDVIGIVQSLLKLVLGI